MYTGNDETRPLLHNVPPFQHPISFTQPPETPAIQVEIQDLKDVYDKVQIKKSPSEQRIVQGKVNGVAWTTGQIKNITAFVQRTPEAAEQVNDTIGWYTCICIYWL